MQVKSLKVELPVEIETSFQLDIYIGGIEYDLRRQFTRREYDKAHPMSKGGDAYKK